MKRLQVLEEMYLVRLILELLSQQSESKQGNMQELRVVGQGYRLLGQSHLEFVTKGRECNPPPCSYPLPPPPHAPTC